MESLDPVPAEPPPSEPPDATQANPSPDVIDLGIGQPGLDMLPHDVLRRAAAARLEEESPALLAYGPSRGDGMFRQALAAFLTEGYGAEVAPEALMVTAGASQALDLVCTLFARPGDVVLVEEPTYFLALRIFADHDLQPVGLPVDEDGLVVEALSDRLTELEQQGRRVAFLYTVPAFQNPTGITLSGGRRRALLAVSQARNLLIVADEVYHLLSYAESPPPPPLAILPGRVISLGSFSKILAPGLRLGWIQAPQPLLETLAGCGLVDSGGALSHFTANIVRVALAASLQSAYLGHLQRTYRRRAEAMARALQEELGDVATFHVPAGGFFFWVRLPERLDTTALLPAARAAGVAFQPGPSFSSHGGLRQWLRLSFTYYGIEALQEGVARLGRVVGDALDGSTG